MIKKDEKILEEYMKTLDFTSLTIDEALRFLCFKIDVRGEAQQLERITRHFSTVFYQQNGKNSFFENEDATWIYACAILMLNSDLHNPQNKVFIFFFSFDNKKDKMTLEQWIKNTKNAPNQISKKPIPDHELERAYNSVLKRQLPIEINYKDVFKQNPLWRHIVLSSRNYLKKYPHNYSASKATRLDCEMFQQVLWGNAISAISVSMYIFYKDLKHSSFGNN